MHSFIQEYFWFILWQFSTNMRQILPISNHNFPHALSWDPLTLPPFTSKSSPSPSSLLFYNPLNSTVLSGCTWVWDHSPQCGHPTSRHSPEERWLSLPQQPSITNCSLAKSPASRSPLPPLLAYWLVALGQVILAATSSWEIALSFPLIPPYPQALSFFLPALLQYFLSLGGEEIVKTLSRWCSHSIWTINLFFTAVFLMATPSNHKQEDYIDRSPVSFRSPGGQSVESKGDENRVFQGWVFSKNLKCVI